MNIRFEGLRTQLHEMLATAREREMVTQDLLDTTTRVAAITGQMTTDLRTLVERVSARGSGTEGVVSEPP